MTTTDSTTTPAGPVAVGQNHDSAWYAGAVAVGAVLIVVAAINQPYNQNEIKQVAPYGSNSYVEITGGTRQPPLDPLLGALIQHLLGEGQLRQRLVPMLAGIGTLVVMGLLMRRLRFGVIGAFGLWMMATAPLMVRYSAYARPYALPLFLMVMFVYVVLG
ncbi:MAG: glycosyltransferase family 39 protein [Propionibacteriales bacterium]|nr:glycosyltransferase family 39 protein [Propionibacteriales bacterium]